MWSLLTLTTISSLFNIGESIQHGRDGCCIRFGWFMADVAAHLHCPLYERSYQLPQTVEQVQWCLTMDDMLRLSGDPSAQSFFNDSNLEPSKYTLLTVDNYNDCIQNSSLCGLLFMSCIMEDCIYGDDTSEPQTTTTYTTPEPEPSINQTTECEHTFTMEQTYVQYTPLPEPNILSQQSTFDNRQPTLKLRFLFAESGSDPWDINITNGETPISPFAGQILITLTDETQQFPGWVECDGREYNVMMYPKLFSTLGYVFGANWNHDTFMIPDCTNKVLIHHSREFIFGITGGNDEIELTQNGVLLPPHPTDFDTGFIDLNNPAFNNLNINATSSIEGATLLQTDIDVSISENIVNYPNTVTEFNNMQRYLALNFMIVTHGKLPFQTKNSDEAAQTTQVSFSGQAGDGSTMKNDDITVNMEHSGADRRFYIGEIVISSNHQVPPGFVACDGSYLNINEYNQLYQVFGFKYGGNSAIHQFKLPDCRGKTFIHKVDPDSKQSLVGETGGEIISEMTENSIPPHTHGEFNFISETNVLAHKRTSIDDNYQCEPVSNWMPYTVMNIGYYNGSNNDPCQNTHYLGGIGIFAFDRLPNDFSNEGLAHDLSNHENNKLINSELMSYISNDFVWSSDCIILPNFEGYLLSHSIQQDEFGSTCGKDTIGCDVLIPHQHVTFITTTDTYCAENQNMTYHDYFDDADDEDDCKIGQWSEYSACMFDESFDQNSSVIYGYQYRTRKLYVDHTNRSNSNQHQSQMSNQEGCPSKSKCTHTTIDFSIDCECHSPSREVIECSTENCLQIIMNGDRKSYFDSKWKLFNKDGIVVASGRDDGYGSEEGCIIVTKGDCYRLHLYDRSGDGLCCEYGNGNIRWYFENELIGFYYNNDNWYEQVINVCIPDYPDDDDSYSDDGYHHLSEDCISVNITGDNDIESENFWNIYDNNGAIVMTSSKPHIVTARDCQCKKLKSGCYDLVVFDESGDGICCKNGDGSLQVTQGSDVLIEYFPKQSDYFTFKTFNFCL